MNDHSRKKAEELQAVLPEIKERPGMWLPLMSPTEPERNLLIALDVLVLNFCWGAGIDDTPLRKVGPAGLASFTSFEEAMGHLEQALTALLEQE